MQISKERKALSSFIHQNLIKMTVQTQPKSTKERKEKKIFGWFIRSGMVGKRFNNARTQVKKWTVCVYRLGFTVAFQIRLMRCQNSRRKFP